MSNLHLDDKEIKRLHDAGLTAQQIAIVMKCSKSTILNHLKKINKQDDTDNKTQQNGNPKHKKLGIPLEKIIELHEQGYSDQEIASKLGCSRSNITMRLNRAGYINRQEKIERIDIRNKISDSLRGTGLGADNHKYKGIAETEDLTQYYKGRARGIFRTLAKEQIRNKGTICEICGKNTLAVETHHIRPFQKILDEFLIDTYDGDVESFSQQLQKYEPFMDTNNLLVVCPTCHSEIHRKDNPELSRYLLE